MRKNHYIGFEVFKIAKGKTMRIDGVEYTFNQWGYLIQ